MEKECKWYFGKEGGIDIGPNDPIHNTFKGNPYYSIVRESIQNSLDAVNDKKLPVSVSFQYFDLDRDQYPSFFKLEEHISQSLEYYNSNGDAKRLFGDMLKYLNGNDMFSRKSKISCLKISDSNTKGMNFSAGTNSPFYAFLRAAGVSSKMLSGSGGSFGFGKGAYFALSPIKTLVVSSKTIDGNVCFEGSTRLTTHKVNSERITAYGYYDNNKGEPTTNHENIPDIFKREKVGTDINIIGLWDEAERDKLMIKSVLNNFWLSIHNKKLTVTINDVLICHENLEQIIDSYFPNELESGNAGEIEIWNPKPYFKAVKYAGENDSFKVFNDKLETLGHVKMYVYLEKGLPNRTSHFRSPMMVVYKKTRTIINGYAAVFVCDDEKGNDILRDMENPAHNVWEAENAPKENGKTNKEAKKAQKEVSDFVIKTLTSLSKINTNSKVAFIGLEEYLSIPEDLLEKDENADLLGNNTNNFSGFHSRDLSQEETSMQTTNFENVAIKPKINVKYEIPEPEKIDETEEGEGIIFTGGNNEGSGGDKPGNTEAANKKNGAAKDNNYEASTLVKVKLKVVAQRNQNLIYHHLLLNVEKDIKNAEIELFVSGDNENEDGIPIIFSDKGRIVNNKLKDIALSAGNNKIIIGFTDNLKHSIKIKAYEV